MTTLPDGKHKHKIMNPRVVVTTLTANANNATR